MLVSIRELFISRVYCTWSKFRFGLLLSNDLEPEVDECALPKSKFEDSFHLEYCLVCTSYDNHCVLPDMSFVHSIPLFLLLK